MINMEQVAANLDAKYNKEQLIELISFLFTDYIDVNRDTVKGLLDHFGSEVKEEFISQVEAYDA